MNWWEALDEYLREREHAERSVPDPWADVELGDTSLTDEQVAYLAFDQPAIPRINRPEPGDLDPGPDPEPDPGAGTGNSPGDD